MKKGFRWASLVAVIALAMAATATAGDDKVTLCHASGLDGTTKYEEITVGAPAAFGPAGHFYENGTPRAGHEQDYLGPCKQDPPPPPPPDPKCPSGYVQEGQGDGYIICVRTVEVPGPERVVTVIVQGPERVVERIVEVPVEKIIERVVEKPVIVTKVITKTKFKTKVRTVVKWKTRVVVKTKKVAATCTCAPGYRNWKGKCYPIVRGNG